MHGGRADPVLPAGHERTQGIAPVASRHLVLCGHLGRRDAHDDIAEDGIVPEAVFPDGFVENAAFPRSLNNERVLGFVVSGFDRGHAADKTGLSAFIRHILQLVEKLADIALILCFTGIRKPVIGIAGRINAGSAAKGIKVQIVDGTMTVDTIITVRYGCSVVAVAKAVQESVTSAVESMTGMGKPIVNVHVSGVAFDK